jgi:hypothetical protein
LKGKRKCLEENFWNIFLYFKENEKRGFFMRQEKIRKRKENLKRVLTALH